MTHPAEVLVSLPIFRRVPVQDLQAAHTLFHHLEIPAGQRVWSQGEAADRMAILVSGRLRVTRAGEDLGKVGPGEVTGEAGGFFEGFARTADADAVEDCKLLVLERSRMGELRQKHTSVYDALLSATEKALVNRIRGTTLELAKRSPGVTEQPERLELSTLQRVWRNITADGPHPSAPLIHPLLGRRPGLDNVPLDQVKRLVAYFTPVKVDQGEVICMEGEPVEDAWLLGEGRVEVYRNVRGDRAEHLTTLHAGDLFGHNGVLNKPTRRSASCVSAERGWIYKMSPKLFGPPINEEIRVWKESMLISLMEQISRANRSLELIVMESLPELPMGSVKPLDERDREVKAAEAIRSARSALEGHSLDQDLQTVRFDVGR